MSYDESKHPRDRGGQWANKPGSGGSSAAGAGFGADADSIGVDWNDERLTASEYTSPMPMAGYEPDDRTANDVAFGMRWAHQRGDQPEDIAYVRELAGQMSDDDFRDLYDDMAAIPADARGPELWPHLDLTEEKVKVASGRGGGQVADDYLASSGTASEGYLGGAAFEGHLAEAKKNLPDREISKLIRADIKAAKDAGYLPKDLKPSVRKSGTGNFRVTATIPQELHRIPKQHPWTGGDGGDEHDTAVNPYYERQHPYSKELASRLATVSGRYEKSDRNAMVDYFNSYRHATVTVTGDDEELQRRRYDEATEKARAHRARQGQQP